MGVLPEALVNYMALLGWAPSGGDREIFTPQELVKEFRLERVTPSPAVFDFEKLYWLNRHYIKQRMAVKDPKLAVMSFHTFGAAGFLGPEVQNYFNSGSEAHDAIGIDSSVANWLSRIVELLSPSVDRLEQLPERAAFIFNYDPKAAIAAADNAEVLASPKTPAVIEAFAKRVSKDSPFTAEQFKAIVN